MIDDYITKYCIRLPHRLRRGVSLHSGAHMTLIPRILDLLKQRNATDIVVFGGGIIPQDDARELKKMGVVEIFGPGTSLQSIIDFVNHGFKGP